MLTMSIRCFTFSQNITERRKIVEMPVIIHKPLGINQRNILFQHASSHTSPDSVSVLCIYNISLILNINLEIIAIIVVMTSVSRLTLLAPNLNHSAERRIGRIHEVNGSWVELTESLSAVCNHEITVSRQSVNLLQLPSLSRRLGKLSQHVADCNVMHLTQTTHVPTTEIPHIVVYEEIVRVHIVRPAIQPSPSPSILLLIDGSTAYQELFHGSGIQFRLSVQLSVTLQHHAHGLTISLFILISSVARRFLALRAVHTQHILHQSSDKVILQWFATLLTDIVFLPDTLFKATLAFELNGITPLVSIAVSLVTQSSLSEVIHVVVVSLSLQQDREGTLIRLVKSVLGCLHAIQFFLVKYHTQR